MFKLQSFFNQSSLNENDEKLLIYIMTHISYDYLSRKASSGIVDLNVNEGPESKHLVFKFI